MTQLTICKQCKQAVKASDISFSRKTFNLKNTCKKCSITKIKNKEKLVPKITKRKKQLLHGITSKEMLDEIKQIKLAKGCESSLCNWGGEFTVRMLEFHHLRDKLFNIGMFYNVENWTRELVLAEIAKCQLLCRNCHALAKNLERYG